MTQTPLFASQSSPEPLFWFPLYDTAGKGSLPHRFHVPQRNTIRILHCQSLIVQSGELTARDPTETGTYRDPKENLVTVLLLFI